MPRYELALIMRLFGREKKIEALKDTIVYLLNEGHNVRNVKSLGDRGLPYQIKAHGETHFKGSYALLDIDCKIEDMNLLRRYFSNNKNIIRMTQTKYERTYAAEEPCDGMEDVDYAKKLEELKRGKLKNNVKKQSFKI
ncbi:small ribosomal subunit protein bS6m-like [Clavelina lepadiformis]|uniref:Small ribosomal subunit protein bS6m n=1 Tax=Clavelina lepadiformis TaxID=159417 RepID=A0ABP0H2E5_CLALP